MASTYPSPVTSAPFLTYWAMEEGPVVLTSSAPSSLTPQSPNLFQNAAGFEIVGGQFVLGDVHNHQIAAHPDQANTSPPPLNIVFETLSESELYCSQLLRRKRGFPLYVPDPQRNLPAEYRRSGVAIGDVGRVTPDGIFDFFFNIFLPPDHPINANIPRDFTPMPAYAEIDIFHLDFFPGNHVSSTTVQRLDLHPSLEEFPGGEFIFSCGGPQGAILALPHGAHLEKLENLEGVRTYAAKHAESWYEYINGPRGRGIANGSLYLITGWEKAPSWGMASFQNVSDEFQLGFRRIDTNRQYRWSGPHACKNPADKKSYDPSPTHHPCNQTTFIHGFCISLATGIWAKLFGGVEIGQIVDSQLGNAPGGPGPYCQGPSSSLFSWSMGFVRGGSTTGGKGHAECEDAVISDFSPISKIFHPALLINNYILEKTPHANVVMSHDDDWCDILRDDETEYEVQTPSDFFQRMNERFEITEKDGAAFLQSMFLSENKTNIQPISVSGSVLLDDLVGAVCVPAAAPPTLLSEKLQERCSPSQDNTLHSSNIPASTSNHPALASSQRISVNDPATAGTSSSDSVSALTSRLPTAMSAPVVPGPSDLAPKTFHRIRSSLEQSLRSAMRSKKTPQPVAGTSTPAFRGGDFNKEKTKALWGFHRSARQSMTPSPSPIPPIPAPDRSDSQLSSFVTPTLQQEPMSSPALHLDSQALPSPKSQSAIPPSSSISDTLVSSTSERTRRPSLQPLQRNPSDLPPTPARERVSQHRATRSNLLDAITMAPTAPTRVASSPQTPRKPTREPSLTPPDTPTPMSGHVLRSSSSASVTQPLTSTPISPRGTSPIQSRSPSNRGVVTPLRGSTPASASHLPLSSSPIPPSPTTSRRPPVDTPRRVSIDSPRRLSIDSPLQPSFREESPLPIQPRNRTPPKQRPSYINNRWFNVVTSPLSPPSNPEHRDLIRAATSMLCKEVVKPPQHMSRTEAGLKDWEEIEVRMRALARLERIWGKSGIGGSSSNLTLGTPTGISAAGEERERRLFKEALRDGFVLCQLMNKLRSSSIVRPDRREDGFVRTSNITKFLAACFSYGLPNEDLFQRDDLIEATSESLARVARTIIALIKYVDAPTVEPSGETKLYNREKLRGSFIDLSRVEMDEARTASGGVGRKWEQQQQPPPEMQRLDKLAIQLGKDKWPDDFMGASQTPRQYNREIEPSESFIDLSRIEEMDETGTVSRSMGHKAERQEPSSSIIFPPPQLAIVGATMHNETVEPLQIPRRPTHRVQHSLDAPSLLPKDSIIRRDSTPDGMPVVSKDSSSLAPRSEPLPRIVVKPRRWGQDPIIRRDSIPDPGISREMAQSRNTKPSIHRSSSLAPRSEPLPRIVVKPRWWGHLAREGNSDSLVPFSRTASGEHSPAGSSPPERATSPLSDKPWPPRGRFQSDVERTSRRRTRPSSYDELGAKPSRSRFESTMNLGVASGNSSASDLLTRDSLDGSFVRQALIIREEGKPPTHFQLGNCIGRGQFGSVYRALNLNTGQMVAVKRIRLEGLKEDEVTTLMREVDLVKSLSHPSIVKYEGMARDQDTLSIVLEYAENGSLGQTLKAFGKLNERLVASYVVKILEGLHYLHSSDVVHCDLKAANILTTKNGNVKLSDFGVSLNLRAMEREIKDVAGTPNWMAPEVIELKGASTKSDIWSLACTVVELLTGRPPYAEIANSMSVMFRIVEDDMPPLPDGCSPLLEDFLSQCFDKDPTKRPSADLLCEHPWLKKNWGIHKELRPQDSIPFLRRVSADLQKSEVVRFMSQVDMPDSPVEGSEDPISSSPPGRRISISSRPMDQDISPRDHSFVKTTFSKPMVCRVCLLNVKKSAVLCEQCSLIAHSKCAVNAPPTCDLRAQLLLYAQYAEKGNPGSAYSNPLDVHEPHPMSPASEVAYVAHTPRTSIDGAPPHHGLTPGHGLTPVTPPTAFKFMAAFKRSRSNLSPEPDNGSSTSVPQVPPKDLVPQKKLRKDQKDRPQSVKSTSTNANTSSMRSGESALSRANPKSLDETRSADMQRKRSRLHSKPAPSEATDLDATISVPGGLPPETRHKKRSESRSSNCIVQ